MDAIREKNHNSGLIAVSIFTNTIPSAPSIQFVETTYNSFCSLFDLQCKIPVTVYCDSNPRENVFNNYYKKLSKKFNVVKTESLSDGYIQSIKNANSKYLFQLEGDWQFEPCIVHSLNEILKVITAKNIYHFRFNKRANIPAVWDKYLDEKKCTDIINDFYYCESNNLSNNPHIIDVERYRSDLINYIELQPGSKGIEERLNKVPGLRSCVYGPANYPATIKHEDGRGCI